MYSSQQSCKMEWQNNQSLTYEGSFGFHWVTNANFSRLPAHQEPTQHTYWRLSVNLDVWISKDTSGSSYSLFTLVFATWWIPKYPSCVSRDVNIVTMSITTVLWLYNKKIWKIYHLREFFMEIKVGLSHLRKFLPN